MDHIKVTDKATAMITLLLLKYDNAALRLMMMMMLMMTMIMMGLPRYLHWEIILGGNGFAAILLASCYCYCCC